MLSLKSLSPVFVCFEWFWRSWTFMWYNHNRNKFNLRTVSLVSFRPIILVNVELLFPLGTGITKTLSDKDGSRWKKYLKSSSSSSLSLSRPQPNIGLLQFSPYFSVLGTIYPFDHYLLYIVTPPGEWATSASFPLSGSPCR